jgi:hypothetical protein
VHCEHFPNVAIVKATKLIRHSLYGRIPQNIGEFPVSRLKWDLVIMSGDVISKWTAGGMIYETLVFILPTWLSTHEIIKLDNDTSLEHNIPHTTNYAMRQLQVLSLYYERSGCPKHGQNAFPRWSAEDLATILLVYLPFLKLDADLMFGMTGGDHLNPHSLV